MASTSVPAPTFGEQGFLAPLESAILAGRLADINAAFGGNLNLGLSTPQGQLASSEAAIIGQVNDTFLFLTNQFDPAYASGRYQDALARIYFIQRNPSQPTVVQCVCTGLSGVVIPVGARALAEDGNIYLCTAAGTIGASGTVILPFACSVPGPIPCVAGTLDQIYQGIPGWDTISNPNDGTLGNNVESRSSFEARRRLSVAQNSVGKLDAILAAVLNVSNVIDALVVENPKSVAAIVGGIALTPNSLYVAAVGGAAPDIAQAIFVKKPPGCGYNGSTMVTVLDQNPNYSPPYPSYDVAFEVPANVSILFAVTLVNSRLIPPDTFDALGNLNGGATYLIQQAIIGAAAGEDGGARVHIGSPVYASRYYCPVAALGAWAQIVSIKVGTTVANLDEVFLTIAQYPAISAGNITVIKQ